MCKHRQYNFLLKGKYHYMANLFHWFGFDQTSKFEVN